jgi:hypothetical protein
MALPQLVLASVDGSIDYRLIYRGKGDTTRIQPIHQTTRFYFFVSVVEASCEYSNQDSTGGVLSGFIRLLGSLVSAMILLGSGPTSLDSTAYSVYCGSVKIGSFLPDSPLLCEGCPVSCLKMANLTSERNTIFLVLRAACLENPENLVFERIGLLVADSMDDSDRRAFLEHIADNSIVRNITLI